LRKILYMVVVSILSWELRTREASATLDQK
jgi:hypothetical protein